MVILVKLHYVNLAGFMITISPAFIFCPGNVERAVMVSIRLQ